MKIAKSRVWTADLYSVNGNCEKLEKRNMLFIQFGKKYFPLSKISDTVSYLNVEKEYQNLANQLIKVADSRFLSEKLQAPYKQGHIIKNINPLFKQKGNISFVELKQIEKEQNDKSFFDVFFYNEE